MGRVLPASGRRAGGRPWIGRSDNQRPHGRGVGRRPSLHIPTMKQVFADADPNASPNGSASLAVRSPLRTSDGLLTLIGGGAKPTRRGAPPEDGQEDPPWHARSDLMVRHHASCAAVTGLPSVCTCGAWLRPMPHGRGLAEALSPPSNPAETKPADGGDPPRSAPDQRGCPCNGARDLDKTPAPERPRRQRRLMSGG